MNRENVKLLLPIVQAFAEGKTIQFRRGQGDWVDISWDGWSLDKELSCYYPADRYRIKPEPRVIKKLYDRNGVDWAITSRACWSMGETDDAILAHYNTSCPERSPFKIVQFVEKLD